MAKTPSLIVDEFFDGGEDTGDSAVRCSTPDPTRYFPLDSQFMEGSGGMPLGSIIPSRAGLRGAIIPRASEGGASQGWDPLRPPNQVVTIDPHISGQSVRVDLSKLTEEQLVAAAKEAKHVDTTGLLAQAASRLRTAATYHVLARQSSPVMHNEDLQDMDRQELDAAMPAPAVPPRPQPVRVVQSMGSKQAVAPAAAVSVAPIAAGTRTVKSLMSNFSKPAGAASAALAAQTTVYEGNVVACPEPSELVTFEMTEGGVHTAYYHKVIVHNATLALAYDARFKGYRFFPVSAKPVAVAYNGQVYLCLCTGIEIPDDQRHYGVMLITKVADSNEGSNGEAG